MLTLPTETHDDLDFRGPSGAECPTAAERDAASGLACDVAAAFLRAAPGTVSRRTALAALSSRTPLNTGWRKRPSVVHPEKATSATSFGVTQCAPRSLTAPSNGDEARARALRRVARRVRTSSLKPDPTLPA